MRKHVQYNLKTYNSISESYDFVKDLNKIEKETKMIPTQKKELGKYLYLQILKTKLD